MTPTATEPVKDTRERVYFSQYPSLRLVVVPADDVPVDNKGNTRRVPGKAIEFADGRYSTSDAGEIEWLTAHPNKDRLFRDITDQMPAPDPQDVIARITALSAEHDRAGLEEIARDELAEWKREAVLVAVESALQALDKLDKAETAKGA